MNPLYFEAHITVDPPAEHSIELFESLCELHNFRPAKMYMLKGNNPNRKDAFCTARDTDLQRIMIASSRLVDSLNTCKFTVRRKKIEVAILDERYNEE